VSENLQARSATELVDAAVQLLKRHYGPLLTISGIGLAPWLILQPLVGNLVRTESGVVEPMISIPGILANLFTTIWFSLAGAAIIVGAAQGYREGRVDVAHAIQQVVSRVPAVLYASLIKGIAIAVGLLLFLVGALYFYSTYFALPTTVVIENLTGRAGVARARQLAQGHRADVLKPLLLVFVIYLIISLAAGALAQVLFGDANLMLANIFSTVVTVFVYPIIPITEMLVYFDLRIRHEGYDVEMMASRLDTTVP
jgi:hypothetical protein